MSLKVQSYCPRIQGVFLMRWFRKKTQSEYMQRQIHILSSVGLFYLIIVGLFAIPLLATFVVVLIQGVFDFRYVILSIGAIVTGLGIYYTGKLCYRLFRKIKQDGAMAIGHARERAQQGESVQLQLFGGLFSLSYGGNNGNKNPEPIAFHGQDPLLIEDMRENETSFQNPVQQLKELSALKDQGVINEEEFRKLKDTLIRNACET
jgi:hypothetical protein